MPGFTTVIWRLDRVIFIPAGRPWLKARSPSQITDAEHRMAMVRLAIANRSHYETSAMELERPGLTYTVDTLAELRSMEESSSGRTEMYLILGMDSIRELRRWHEPERLFEMCMVVAVSRPDTEDVTPCSFERDFPGRREQVRAAQGANAEHQRDRRAQPRRQRATHRQLRAAVGGAVHPRPRSLPRNVVSWACRSDSCGGVQRMSSQVLG